MSTGVTALKTIRVVGGPLHGKNIADRGQLTHKTTGGGLYQRVRI
jgi:hypothetical protein